MEKAKPVDPGRPYFPDLIERLKDPEHAAAYLDAALEDGDPQAFLLALRHVIEAQGGMTSFSKRAKMNRVSLYKMLSEKGNPEFSSLLSILKALHVHFKIGSS